MARIFFVNILSFVFFLSGTIASCFAAAPVPSCIQKIEALLTEKDFGPSVFWTGNQSGKYPLWAAQAALTTAKMVAQGAPIETVFDWLAKARFELAQDMDESDPGQFGRRRPEGAYKSDLGVFPLTEEDGKKSIFIEALVGVYERYSETEKEVLSQALSKIADWRANDAKAMNIDYYKNHYQLLDGTKAECSVVCRNLGVGLGLHLLVRHPGSATSNLVFKDVIVRLERIKSFDRSDIQEFLKALYGYYNAMPYLRGSSAIGRSFFEGYYAAVFGKKMPSLPDGIDLRAMVLTEEEFVRAIEPLF